MNIFKNAYYNKRNSIMHIWSQDIKENASGEYTYEDKYEAIKWSPFVYVRTDKSQETSFEGIPVKRKEFRNYYEYSDFCKKTSKKVLFENFVRPEVQFFSDKYYSIPDDKIIYPHLKVYFLDIETQFDNGYSRACFATNKITLISVKDKRSGKVITWGLKPYTGERDVEFRCFHDDEESMLRDFVNFAHENPPDVWTGWNVYKYDFQYIFVRLLRLFGEEEGDKLIKRISSINETRYWKKEDAEKGSNEDSSEFLENFQNQYFEEDEEDTDSSQENILKIDDTSEEEEIEWLFDIPGSVILDYMDLYKKYSRKMRENYKLATILIAEDTYVKKLDYKARGYKDLRELENKNWDLYTDYNIDDIESLDDLDDKLDYINTALALCLYAKVPLKSYNAVSQINEGVIATYCRRNKLCLPYFGQYSKEKFEAGWVKEPKRGMKKWFIDLDITSSYPTHIIILNMSVETYYGRICNMTESEVIFHTRKRKFPEFQFMKRDSWKPIIMEGDALRRFNTALERGLFAISPIGSIFTTNKLGVLPAVQLQGFNLRYKIKQQMIEKKDEATKLEKANKKDEAKKIRIEQKKLHALQYAIKIVLNGLYGCTSFVGSRYYNIWIASAITSCGRNTVKKSEVFVNELLNSPTEELKLILDEISSK